MFSFQLFKAVSPFIFLQRCFLFYTIIVNMTFESKTEVK